MSRLGGEVKTPRKRQAEREVFIGTPERGSETRSSRVRQVYAPSEVQGVPSVPVVMQGGSSVPSMLRGYRHKVVRPMV